MSSPREVPAEEKALPYGRQSIDEEDIRAVVDVLRSDWLTTGPNVEHFEQAVATKVKAAHGVAVCNGTAALHAAYHTAGVGPGDEVIVPTMTFAATANAAVYQGATPVFSDCDADTLLIDIESVKERITKNTKAIVGVDFAGQPCDWKALRDLAQDHDLVTVCDGAHALGAVDADGTPIGAAADLTTFSFHPVKHITTGEGGMIVTDDDGMADRMRTFRNHGLTSDHRERESTGQMVYDMPDVGYNLRLSDIHAALGTSQLRHLDEWVERRNTIADLYSGRLDERQAEPLEVRRGVRHAYHLFIVRVDDRDQVLQALRAEGIGANIHYKPVHMHSYYQKSAKAECPNAEAAFKRILSLPMFPAMTDQDVDRVVAAL